MEDNDFEFLDSSKLSLEEIEDEKYRTNKPKLFGSYYPYSTAEDFKYLTSYEILTRRFKYVKPEIYAGIKTSQFLNEDQRKSLLKLTSMKSIYNKMKMTPVEQEINRKREIKDYIIKNELVSMVMDQENENLIMDKREKIKDDDFINTMKSKIKTLKSLRSTGGSIKPKKSRKPKKYTKSHKSSKPKSSKPKSRKSVKR